MRILALVMDAFGGSGGIAHYNRDLMTAFTSIGEVEEIVLIPRVATKGIVVTPSKIREKFAAGNRFFYCLQVLFCLRTDGPFDMVFCGHLHLMPLAWLAARLSKKPLWLQIYGLESWSRPNFMRRFSVRTATLVTTISRYTRKQFLSWADLDPERVKVLPNAAENQFQRGPKLRKLEKYFGIVNKKVLLTVGRLEKKEKYKGHDIMFAVLPRLIKHFPNIAYLIVGEGNDKSRLQAIAHKRGIGGSVVFTGRVKDEVLPDIYRLADVFTMPSTREGFGFVFLEAVASGLPVLAGNKDGSVDALLDGRNGVLVNPEDEEEIFQGLSRLLTSERSEPGDVSVFSFNNFQNHVKTLIWKITDRYECQTA